VLLSEAEEADTTPPTITAEVSPPPDVRGWHLPPVTVEFSCADAETEVADCPAALTLTEPGIHPVEGVATDGAGNEAATSLEVPVARPVGIDIVPFIGLNLIPCRASNAPIPVAILSGPGFDARAVDADSVRFGRTGDEAAAFLRDRHGRPIGHVLDVNRDRRPDLVLYFRLGDTGFGCGDIGRGALIASVPAVLTGVADGVGIHAQSTLRLVGLGR
jgi:hypothetical protein